MKNQNKKNLERAASFLTQDGITDALAASGSQNNDPLPFTYKNMVDLLHAYKASLWIEDFFLTATNMAPDVPLLQELLHLDSLIYDLCPFLNTVQVDENDLLTYLLEYRHLKAEEAASVLMGYSHMANTEFTNLQRTGADIPDASPDTEGITCAFTPSITFTAPDMACLLRAYDAFKDLKTVLSLGDALDPKNRIILGFGRIETLLKDLSPIYSDNIQYFTKVLEDESLDPLCKARILSGSPNAFEAYKSHSAECPSPDEKLSVPFTEKNMVDLLTAIYAYECLDEVLEMFTSTYLDNRIIYGLSLLKEILLNISPRYDMNADDDSPGMKEYFMNFCSLDIGLRNKARWLMGGSLQ